MAKKGQKFKSCSEETKAEVLRKYLEEYIPSSVLEEEYGIPQKTIRNLASKLKQGKNVLVDHRQFSSGILTFCLHHNPTTKIFRAFSWGMKRGAELYSKSSSTFFRFLRKSDFAEGVEMGEKTWYNNKK